MRVRLAGASSVLRSLAAEYGGAIDNDGPVTVDSLTIYESYSPNSGGIHNSGVFTISNSIVANSLGGAECENSNGGTLIDGGHNIVEDSSCNIAGGSDPLLGPLGDNGGPTPTHALLSGSPAIDNGYSLALTDQRGVPRPQGIASDIGAFELQQSGSRLFIPIVVKR